MRRVVACFNQHAELRDDIGRQDARVAALEESPNTGRAPLAVLRSESQIRESLVQQPFESGTGAYEGKFGLTAKAQQVQRLKPVDERIVRSQRCADGILGPRAASRGCRVLTQTLLAP